MTVRLHVERITDSTFYMILYRFDANLTACAVEKGTGEFLWIQYVHLIRNESGIV